MEARANAFVLESAAIRRLEFDYKSHRERGGGEGRRKEKEKERGRELKGARNDVGRWTRGTWSVRGGQGT